MRSRRRPGALAEAGKTKAAAGSVASETQVELEAAVGSVQAAARWEECRRPFSRNTGIHSRPRTRHRNHAAF